MKRKSICYALQDQCSLGELRKKLSEEEFEWKIGIDETDRTVYIVDERSERKELVGEIYNINTPGRYIKANEGSRLVALLDAYEPVKARER